MAVSAALMFIAAPAAAHAAGPVATITSGPTGTVSTPEVTFTFSANEPVNRFICAIEHETLAKTCSSPFTVGPLAPGLHFFYVEAVGATGAGPFASRMFTIAGSSPTLGPTEGGLGGLGVKPVISSLTQSAATWREGSGLPHISRAGAKPPQGTTFSFALSEAATVKLTYTQRAPGRTVGGRCVAQTSHNRTKRACRRTLTAGAVTLKGHLSTNQVRFEGRLSASRKLKPGRYTLMLTASADGISSAASSLTFTIVG